MNNFRKYLEKEKSVVLVIFSFLFILSISVLFLLFYETYFFVEQTKYLSAVRDEYTNHLLALKRIIAEHKQSELNENDEKGMKKKN